MPKSVLFVIVLVFQHVAYADEYPILLANRVPRNSGASYEGGYAYQRDIQGGILNALGTQFDLGKIAALCGEPTRVPPTCRVLSGPYSVTKGPGTLFMSDGTWLRCDLVRWGMPDIFVERPHPVMWDWTVNIRCPDFPTS